MILLGLFIVYAIALSVALGRAGLRSPVTIAAPPVQPIARILLIGATGGTGRQLLAQVLERGYHVTALVRNPAKFKVEHPNLVVMPGNVLDYASVEQAMRGQDAVLSALGHKRFFYPTRILSEGTRNLLRAMETHGVCRFVCETSLGIGNSAGRGGLLQTFLVIPIVLQFYFWDKARQERLIAASKVPWVIVRPGTLTNGAARGKYQHGRNMGSFLWPKPIARADVADFMLRQLTDDTYLGTAVGVCW
jgi:putative NADH-flavin reductase